MQVGGDIVNDLAVVSQLLSQRPIDDSLSLWLEVGTIKPALRLYVAVAEFINLQQLMSKRCVVKVFTARRYVSAAYAMALCLSVSVCLCLSVASRSSTKMPRWIELIFGMEAPFHLYILHCVLRKRVTPKIRVLPPGTLSGMLD